MTGTSNQPQKSTACSGRGWAEAEGQAISQRLHSDYRPNLLWYLTASLTTPGCSGRILSTFIPKHFTSFINDPLDSLQPPRGRDVAAV